MPGAQYGHNRKLIYKICKICGDSFETKSNKQVFCIKCKKINYQKKYPRVQFPKKICEVCGCKYQSKSHRQKFCKPECSKIYQKIIYIEKRKEQGKEAGRWQILNRDNFTCQYCGKNPTEDKVKLHVDHIKPKIAYGTNDIENLVTSCDGCNLEKGSKLIINEGAFKERLLKANKNIRR